MSMQTSAVIQARRTDLWGLCPRCHAWFDCSGWSDLPAPACPSCGLPAQRVVRVDAAGAGPEPSPRAPGMPETWIG